MIVATKTYTKTNLESSKDFKIFTELALTVKAGRLFQSLINQLKNKAVPVYLAGHRKKVDKGGLHGELNQDHPVCNAGMLFCCKR